MGMTRFYFDKLIAEQKSVFPDIVEDLAANSRLVHCPAFENGIVKIQNGDEAKLTQDEKKAVSIFLLTNETSDDDEEIRSNEEDERHSFINEGRREAQERAAKKLKTSKYRSTLHVSPTSCICEQTNSQAKFIMNNIRKHIDPLKFNANMWDVNTIHEII